MKCSNWSFVLASVVLAGACLDASAQTKVVVDPGKKYQVFEGFGSSLCWWAVKVGAWNEANRDKLLGAVADPDTGLGYNIFRYNIGGGDQPGHNHLTKGDGGAAVPGYKPTEKGDYDWDADAGQRDIAIKLSKLAKEPIFEAFSNSPPWWMTNSGCVSGGNNGADNLKTDYFDDFADYLSEVAKHFKDEWGITFRTVEPFNEPSAGWWSANGNQEGCGFKNNQSKMIVELGKALKAKGLFPETSVSAADESNIGTALSQFNGYTDEALSYMFQVNTHSYSGHDSRTKFYNAAFAKDKRIWQSESGPLNGTGNENIALFMAGVIMGDIRDMKANAWVDWQLGDPGENWRTIALDHKKQAFSYGVRYYMHAAFSRVLRPGSRIIDSDNGNTLAALRSDGSLVLIVRNSSGSDVKYNFDLSGFDKIGTTAKVNMFALPGSLTPQADLTVSNKSLAMTAKSNTVTTMVIEGAEGGVCKPSDIVPYVNINDAGWNETTEVNVKKGASIVIGPHPWEGGRWVWTGPKEFKSTNREINLKNMDGTMSGIYNAVYTNSVGCESTVDIKVIVDDPEHPYVEPAKEDTTKKDSSRTFVHDFGKQTTGVSAFVNNGELFVTAPKQELLLSLFDMQGVLVASKSFSNGNVSVSLRSMTQGAYFIRIQNNRGKVLFQNVVKNL